MGLGRTPLTNNRLLKLSLATVAALIAIGGISTRANSDSALPANPLCHQDLHSITVVLTVDDVWWNCAPIDTKTALPAKLKEAAAVSNASVRVRARSSRFEDVAAVLGEIDKATFRQVSFTLEQGGMDGHENVDTRPIGFERTTASPTVKGQAVSVDFDGELRWNGQPISGDALTTDLKQFAAIGPKKTLYVAADRLSKFSGTVSIIAEAQRIGITKIVLLY